MKKILLTMCFVVILMTMFIACASAECDHVYGNWFTTREATCIAEGTQERRCLRCNDLDPIPRKIQKKDHDIGNPGCEVPATCSMCSAVFTPPIGHYFSPATCVNPQTCYRCGKTTGGLGEHQYAPATCTKLSTCKICNTTTGTYKRHIYQNGICIECGKHY